MIEASTHILSGVNNLVNPDLDSILPALLAESDARRDSLYHEAPDVVATASQWILDNTDEICDILASLSGDLPMSRPMLVEAFHNCVDRWKDADKLRAFVREELTGTSVGGAVRPRLVFHNLAGNLFVSGWESICHATLLGAASVVRCSDLDRVFPAIWVRALTNASPELSKMLLTCEWSSSDGFRFQRAVAHADAVVTYGSDEAVTRIRELTSWNRPFAAHGSTFSFSLIDSSQLKLGKVDQLAARAAYDFCVYDQQGCLSPRALFLQDKTPRDVDRFVDALLDSARRMKDLLPRVRLSLEDQAALARSRHGVLLDAAVGGSSRLVSNTIDPFLITVKSLEAFELGPVNRYIDVYLYKNVQDVHKVLEPFAGHLSTLAVADTDDAPAELVNRSGFTRICDIGWMQKPAMAWSLDGLRPLQKLCRFQSIQ